MVTLFCDSYCRIDLMVLWSHGPFTNLGGVEIGKYGSEACRIKPPGFVRAAKKQ